MPTEHGLLLLAAQPILTSQGSGPAHGVIVFGRFLDQALLKEFAAQTHVAFELFAPDDARLAPAEEALLGQLLPGETRFQLDAQENLVVYSTLTGLDGEPAALLRTPVRKDITATGDRTAALLAISAGLGALALLLAGVYLSARDQSAQREAGGRTAWAAATLTLLVGMTLVALVASSVHTQNETGLAEQFNVVAEEQANRFFELRKIAIV